MSILDRLPLSYKEKLNKALILVGILIIIYAILWIGAELKIIPVVIFAIFPQIVLLCIGIFIVYMAYTNKKKYY